MSEIYGHNCIQKIIDEVQAEAIEEKYNPREDDNLGTMVCFHGRYKLGDEHGLTMAEAKIVQGDADNVTLPLYLFDHSVIRMNTTGYFTGGMYDRFDSGCVGFIYATKGQIRDWYKVKRITPAILGQARKELEQEVKSYDEYISG